MVDLEWYRTFKAIYQSGTLTGAAQELLISQPNVSQHLSALEAHVGKQLFERQPRRMVPTEYGKLFYTQIIEAIEKLEHVESEFRYTRASDVPLTCIGTPLELFVTNIARQLSKTPANLVIEFGLTKDLMSKLGRSKLSFVIATHRTEEKDVVYEPLFDEQFLLVGDMDMDTNTFDKHIKRSELDRAEEWLCQQDWFAYSSDLAIVRRFWQQNFKKRPSIKPRFIIPDHNAIFQAIANGKGIAIVPDVLVKEQLKQKKIKLIWKGAVASTNTIYLAYNRNNVTTAQIEMVRKLYKM